jgi:hypothetical protein
MEPKTLPITVKLLDPVEYGSERITEVTITRKARVKDIMNLNFTGEYKIQSEVALFSRLLRLPAPAVEMLSLDDYLAITDAISPFLGNFRQTGEK